MKQWRYEETFLEYQISKVEIFLKDHVILKTGFAITGIHYILKYINIEKLF